MGFVEVGASRTARIRRSIVSVGLAGLLAATGVFAGSTPAFAVEAVVSQVGVSVSFDGTGPFDADDAPGHDSGELNGVVRSVDQVEYLVASSFASLGDAAYTAQLPNGMVWDVTASANTVCTGVGGGTLSSDKRTLRCNRTVTGINESFKIRAWVDHAGNGETVAPTVSVGGVSATAPAITVSAVPKTELRLYTGWANMPVVQDGKQGVSQGVFALIGAPKPASGNFKGYEGLAPSYSFFVAVPEHGKVIAARESLDRGSVAVEHPATPGGLTKITVSGQAQGLLNATVSTLAPTDFMSTYQIAISIWTPYDPGIPINVPTPLAVHVSGFDPVSASGVSNFGDGYAPGQEPTYVCPTAPLLNSKQLACVRETVTRTDQPQLGATVGASLYKLNDPLYGDSHGYPMNQENVVVGQPYVSMTGIFNGVTAGAETSHAWGMLTWDPKLHQLTGPVQVRKFASGLVDAFYGRGYSDVAHVDSYRVEYSDHPFADDTARRTTDPNSMTWVSTPEQLPNGVASATAVRLITVDGILPNTGIGLVSPFVRPSTSANLAVNTLLPWFWQYGSDETPRVQSTYNGTYSPTGASVRTADALIRSKAAWSSSAVAPGDVKNLVVTPTAIGPVGATADSVLKGVTLKVTLDSVCTEPVWSAVKLMDGYKSHTPADFGPDGIACTSDDGSPAQVVFALGDIVAPAGPIGPLPIQGHASPLQPISIPVAFSPLTPSGTTYKATIVASASNDSSIESYEGKTNLTANAISQDRTEFASIMVQGVASFSGGKTAVTQHEGFANPHEEFSYTINWGNGTSDKVGRGTFVDLLPYNGDSRGTSGMPDGGFTVITAAASTSNTDVMGGVSVEYTTDPSADVAAALIREGNSDGHEGVNWKTGTVTSSATALRFVTEQEIDPGFAGSATITVSVDGLGVGGVLKNDFYGKTTEVNGDPNTVKTIVGAAELTLRSSAASLAGTVYRDNDFSGTVSDADTTWASGSQTLTISNEFGSFTTDIAANGTYDFGIIPGGDYAATLTDGQGWALVLPNPISIAIGDIRVAENLLFQEAVAVPTAVADTASTSAGQSVTVNVKKNDTWPNATAPAAQTAAVIAVGGEATYGTATLTTDGTLSYTASTVWPTEHDGAESYQDTITYVVTNAAGGTASATVTVTVYPSPVAANDSATVRDGKPTTLNVLSNDAGNSIAIVPGSVATAGDATASIVDGTVSVIPTHTWAVGEKTYETAIDYTIEDAFGQRSSATVTVTVQRAPVVTGQSNLTIASDGTATFSPAVLNPDVLEAGGVAVASKPKGSTVVVGDDGSITFVPGTAGVGEHTFTVDYTDNLGQTTTHTFTVTVYEALAGVADEATVRSDTASTLNVLVNDRGDALQLVDAGSSWTIDPATAANAGSVTIVNGSLEYTPFGTYQWAESELSYAETLSYVVEDAHGKRETVTVVVTVIRPPSGVDRHLTVEPEFEKVIFDPIGEATGTGIVPLADSDIVADPAHGVVEILGGVVHYVPTPGFVGDDTFVVRMTDVVGQTTEVRYTVTVLAADAPAPTAPGTGGESAKPQPGGPVTENPSDRLTDPETSGSRDAGARGLAVTGTGATSGWTVTALAFAMMLGLSLVAQQRLRRAEADRVS